MGLRKVQNKSDGYGVSKAPKNPISVGEEYIVTIEETSKSGTGVAKIRGFVVLVNNSNPGERVKIRIRQVIAIMQWLTSLQFADIGHCDIG